MNIDSVQETVTPPHVPSPTPSRPDLPVNSIPSKPPTVKVYVTPGSDT